MLASMAERSQARRESVKDRTLYHKALRSQPDKFLASQAASRADEGSISNGASLFVEHELNEFTRIKQRNYEQELETNG